MTREAYRNRIATCTLAALLFVALAAPSFTLAGKSDARTSGEARSAVDINTAGAEELTTLPGIGKAMARRIIEFRDANGPFRRVEDLLKIKGIGEKSFEKLRPLVKVSKKG